ncbi:hypothetical protein [Cystobacter ferrugineus]|uniref:Uncharacterized protein n=1 Tax=Cystobacter ferrugineus TaxID=83449 RepID=A0A1L9B9P7_9BACT|nr:hypothetical protein [Cystobacter ferrugineus]OJH38923.1 hypothetical protein BON30_22175 [Cystobacter ferrugineus]
MASRPPTYERHVDGDGVVRIQKKNTSQGTWLIWLALGFTAGCAALCAWLLWPEDPSPTPERAAPARAMATPPPPPPPRTSNTPAPLPHAEAPPAPTPEPVAPRDEPEEPSDGVHLYRPGTKPLKQGLVVPEGFELPPGYVRHYQSTDDGQAVKPILMFHPDYHPTDSNGQPVELPANRVVPMELAPPGMPLEVLELPEGPEGVEPLP